MKLILYRVNPDTVKPSSAAASCSRSSPGTLQSSALLLSFSILKQRRAERYNLDG